MEDYFEGVHSENTKNTKWAVSMFKQWIMLCEISIVHAVDDTIGLKPVDKECTELRCMFVSGGSLESER